MATIFAGASRALLASAVFAFASARPRVVGMITRSDILSCYRQRIDENLPQAPVARFSLMRRLGRHGSSGKRRTA